MARYSKKVCTYNDPTALHTLRLENGVFLRTSYLSAYFRITQFQKPVQEFSRVGSLHLRPTQAWMTLLVLIGSPTTKSRQGKEIR